MKRNLNIDFMKTIAILSVILIHMTSTSQELALLAPLHYLLAMPIFMIISGFNSAKSYSYKNYSNVKEYYDWQKLFKKIIKLWIPYSIVFIIQLLIIFISGNQLSLTQLITGFFTGGFGPGGYFMLILIQGILITPLIYKLMEKNNNIGLVTMFVISTVTELMCKIVNINPDIYRILIVRYIFAIAIGIWMAKNKNIKNYLWISCLSILSVIYIVSVQYYGKIYLTEYMWTAEHAPAYFYVSLIVFVGLHFYDLNKLGRIGIFVTLIGSKSYYIYLAQMIYFMLPITYSDSNIMIVLQIVLGFVACILGGVVLEAISKKITVFKNVKKLI